MIFVKKFRELFGLSAESLPDNATEAEIDNAIDDALEAQKKIGKSKENTETLSKVDDLEKANKETFEKHSGVMKKLNDDFGQKIKAIEDTHKAEIEKLTNSFEAFKTKTAEELKNLKIGKSKDTLTEEEAKALKEKEEGEKITSATFMQSELG